MSLRPRRVSPEKTIRALKLMGFVQVRQHGSHVILRRQTSEGATGCVVPVHRSSIPIGTLCNILREAGVTSEEFMKNL